MAAKKKNEAWAAGDEKAKTGADPQETDDLKDQVKELTDLVYDLQAEVEQIRESKEGESGEGYVLSVGDIVEFKQRKESLPMIVTHIHDDDMISGVALSGFPTRIGWSRGGQEFSNIKKGDDNRNWRHLGAEDAEQTDALDIE